MINQLYSNVYVGDSSISRIYQGENLIFVSEHPDICLEYIDNGTARTQPLVCFDTGVVPTIATKTEIKFSAHTNMANTVLFGTSDANASSASRYYYMLYAGLDGSTPTVLSNKMFIQSISIGPEEGVPAVDIPHISSIWGTIRDASSLSGINMICDSSVYAKNGITGEITTTNSIYLLARNVNDTADRYCPASTRVYYMKIWEANNLIRFYIPVLHWNNGQYVPCFYDKVNDTYIYNLGTDTPTYKIQGDYLLDYLQCGNDYTNQAEGVRCAISYDTGLHFALGQEVHLKVNNGNAVYSGSSQENFVVGDRYTSSVKYAIYAPNASYGVRMVWLGVIIGTSIDNTGKDSIISMTYEGSSTRRAIYLNGTQYLGNQETSMPEGAENAVIYINRNSSGANTWAGNKYYYVIIDKDKINQRTYVPVLHNGKAMFYDCKNNNYLEGINKDTSSSYDNTLIYSF